MKLLFTSFLFILSTAYAKTTNNTNVLNSSNLSMNSTPIELKLNWVAEPEFGGFYAAQEEGIFKKYSLNINIVPGNSGTPTVQVLAAGKTDFAIVSGEEILISRSHNTDVVAIFSVYQTFPRVIMSRAERNFKSIQDVFEAPGSIAVQSGIPFFTFLEKKFGKPKAKTVPYLGGITNFLSDPQYSQQAYLNSEPILAKKKGIQISSFLVANEGYNPYSAILATRKSVLEKNPELVKKLVIAVREGWKLYLEKPEKTNILMHQLNPSMDLQTFSESSAAQRNFIETEETKKSGLGSMNLERWKTLAEQLKSIGAIKQIPNIQDMYKNF